jgi:hypothetical protein
MAGARFRWAVGGETDCGTHTYASRERWVAIGAPLQRAETILNVIADFADTRVSLGHIPDIDRGHDSQRVVKVIPNERSRTQLVSAVPSSSQLGSRVSSFWRRIQESELCPRGRCLLDPISVGVDRMPRNVECVQKQVDRQAATESNHSQVPCRIEIALT